MKTDFIDMIEPTPQLTTKKCRFISLILRIFLQFSLYVATIIAWIVYDYFVAGATLLLSYIIIGIIRAKLRNSVIPVHQREYHYTDQGIANWYTAYTFCTTKDIKQ